MKKLPAFQFYPGDWMKDPNLRRCSHAAKGVWMDMLCLMHENQERGYLATAGIAWSDDDIALAVGGDKSIVLACIAELTLKGVAKRDARGALYSKRMVGDDRKRRLCRDAGKKGGNPALLAQNSPTLKGQVKGEVNGSYKPELTPSSSSSTSVNTPLPPSGGIVGEGGIASGLKPKPEPSTGRWLPYESWMSDSLKSAFDDWHVHLTEKGIRPTTMTQKTWRLECQRFGIARGVDVVRFSISKGAKSLLWDTAPAMSGAQGSEPSRGNHPLDPLFPAYLAENPHIAERAEDWKTTGDLPLSVRDDFAEWRAANRRSK